MNELELKQYCREHAGEAMPAEAEALLRRDPALKREVDQLLVIRRLMSLKKYEQPAPGSVERCLRGVHARVEAERNHSVFQKLRAWFEYESPVPAYALAAAVLAIALTGVSAINVMRTASEGVAIVVQDPEPVILVEQPVVETNGILAVVAEPAIEKPIIMLRVQAPPVEPAGRGGLTFGGDSSVPVSYER